jgi:hypothetical protein
MLGVVDRTAEAVRKLSLDRERGEADGFVNVDDELQVNWYSWSYFHWYGQFDDHSKKHKHRQGADEMMIEVNTTDSGFR